MCYSISNNNNNNTLILFTSGCYSSQPLNISYWKCRVRCLCLLVYIVQVDIVTYTFFLPSSVNQLNVHGNIFKKLFIHVHVYMYTLLVNRIHSSELSVPGWLVSQWTIESSCCGCDSCDTVVETGWKDVPSFVVFCCCWDNPMMNEHLCRLVNSYHTLMCTVASDAYQLSLANGNFSTFV